MDETGVYYTRVSAMRELPPLREIQPSVPFRSPFCVPQKPPVGTAGFQSWLVTPSGAVSVGTGMGGTGPNFPRSPLQWISTHPCSLAWLWEVTSSVPSCKKRLRLSTKRLASEDSDPSTQSWGWAAREKRRLLLCPSR